MNHLPPANSRRIRTLVPIACLLHVTVLGAEKKENPVLDVWLHAHLPESQPWDVGGEVRGRFESKNGAGVVANTDFISGVAESREAIYLRSKIHIGYKPSPWLALFVEGRDASGHEDPKATDRFDLYQAYLTLGDLHEFPVTIQIGRQELLYGDERLVGKGQWPNLGKSFDAFRVHYESSSGFVDVFTSRPVLAADGEFNINNDYDTFSGIYSSFKKLIPWQDTQLYFLARNAGRNAPNALDPGVPGNPSTQRDIYTIGTLWKSNTDALCGLDYSIEACYQFGSVYNATLDDRLDQQSYAFFMDGGYTWKDTYGTPRLGIGYEYGSGDDDATDGKVETFESLFAINHRGYGLMDVTSPRNIHIPKLAFSLKPVKGLTLSVDYLWFILASTNDYFYPESGGGRSGNGYGINSGFGSFVGSEIDIYASYTVNNWLNIQAGYGHFFTGDYIEDTVASTDMHATDADWLYTQFTFNF